jgi:hypothetical protein
MSWAGVIAGSVPIFIGVLAILAAQQSSRAETEPSQLDQASERQLAHPIDATSQFGEENRSKRSGRCLLPGRALPPQGPRPR